jgi:hypothetical protein
MYKKASRQCLEAFFVLGVSVYGRFLYDMTDIADYFSLPDTHRTWSKGIALFMAHCAVNDPQLTAQLASGPYGSNQALLDRALLPLKNLATLRSRSLPPPAPPMTREDVTEASVTLNSLHKERRGILQRRAKTSQQFHSCKTDAERALICDAIDLVDAELEKCVGDIEYFRIHGFPPPPPKEGETDAVQLPEDRDGLDLLRSQLSSRRTKLRKRVTTLLELPDNAPKRSDIPKKRKGLNDCDKLLERVKAAIANTPR